MVKLFLSIVLYHKRYAISIATIKVFLGGGGCHDVAIYIILHIFYHRVTNIELIVPVILSYTNSVQIKHIRLFGNLLKPEKYILLGGLYISVGLHFSDGTGGPPGFLALAGRAGGRYAKTFLHLFLVVIILGLVSSHLDYNNMLTWSSL